MSMPILERAVNSVLRSLIHALYRVDSNELDRIPSIGPAILVTNHSTNLEGPIYYVLLDPRKTTALGKRELWANPFTRFLMQLWGVIPLNRGGADRRALRRAKNALARGEFLGIAPEGTRSASGTLQRGRPGAAMLATSAHVPIIPMVQWGVQDLFANLKRLRKTPLHFRVGAPFYLNVPGDGQVERSDLRTMTDEIMYQLAILLPKPLRGYYADIGAMTERYIVHIREFSIWETRRLPD